VGLGKAWTKVHVSKVWSMKGCLEALRIPKTENKKTQHKHMEDTIHRRLCSSNSNNQKPNHNIIKTQRGVLLG
jgi:hypothetical protein